MGRMLRFLLVIMFMISKAGYSVPKMIIQYQYLSSISDVWDIQIISDYKDPRLVVLKVNITDMSNTLLYDGISGSFLLQPGMSNFADAGNPVSIQYQSPKISMNHEQKLRLQVMLYDPLSSIEIANANADIIIGNTQSISDTGVHNGSKTGKDGFKKNFSFKGVADLTGHYNTRKDTLFYLPVDFFRAKINLGINLYGVPVALDVYQTTEQRFTTQRINSVSFRFDVEQFKQNLIARLSDEIEKRSGIKDVQGILNQSEGLKKYTDDALLDSIVGNKLISESYATKYKEYIQFDSLRQISGISNDIEYKKYISKLNLLTKGFDTKVLDSLMKLYVTNDTLCYCKDTTQLPADSISSIEDSSTRLLNNEYVMEVGKSIGITIAPDTLLSRISYDSLDIYTAILNVRDSVLSRANRLNKIRCDTTVMKMMTAYNKMRLHLNEDSLHSVLSKYGNYSVSDLISLKAIKEHVSDKISSFDTYRKDIEIEELKRLNTIDINSLTINSASSGIIKKYGLLNRKELALNGIRKMGIGTVYPYISDMTVNGAMLNGYDVAYNYKNIYIGSTGGKQLNIFNDSIARGNTITKNMLYGLVLGYGDKSRNYIHLNYIYAKRVFVVDSLNNSDRISINHVVSADFGAEMFKGKLSLSGELPVSFTSISNGSEPFDRKKTGYGGRLNIGARIFKGNIMEISAEYVNRDYESYGLPFLLRNRIIGIAKSTQRIGKYLTIGGGYRNETYLSDSTQERGNSYVHRLIASATIKYKKHTVSGTYMPGWLSFGNRDKTTISDANVSYNVQYSRKNASFSSQIGAVYTSFYNTSLVYSGTGSVILENNIRNISSSLSVYVVQNLAFSNKYMLSANFNFVNNKNIAEGFKNIAILAFKYSHIITPSIRYSLATQYVDNIRYSKRLSLMGSLLYNVNRYMEINTKVQYDYLRGEYRESYYDTNGFLIQVGVVLKY